MTDDDAAMLLEVAPDWHRRAACAGLPERWGDVFFPSGEDGDNDGNEAKAICARCPVWRECITGAAERGEKFGVWGGAGGALLRPLTRAHRAGAAAWQSALDAHRAHLDDVAAGRRPVVATDANGPAATCGAAVTYARGCRCEACQWGMRWARNQRPDGREHPDDQEIAA